MNLSPLETRAVYYVLEVYREAGQPWTNSVAALHRAVTHAIRGLSQERQCSVVAQEDSTHVQYVGSRIAAQILGWSVRRVQRHAADLDGRKLNPRQYMFPLNAVIEYRDNLQKGGN